MALYMLVFVLSDPSKSCQEHQVLKTEKQGKLGSVKPQIFIFTLDLYRSFSRFTFCQDHFSVYILQMVNV